MRFGTQEAELGRADEIWLITLLMLAEALVEDGRGVVLSNDSSDTVIVDEFGVEELAIECALDDEACETCVDEASDLDSFELTLGIALLDEFGRPLDSPTPRLELADIET